VTKAYQSVWDAIESSPAEAASMKARADLMQAVRDVVDKWDVTQVQAAKRLHISQPRLNDLLRGKLGKFSLEALVGLAVHSGLKVNVKITRQAA
jgi:predicted XRE-type DNA-binding protein